MKNFFITAWRFIVKSSADPKSTSLAVKGFGLMAITIFTTKVVPGLHIVCQLGYLCEFVEPSFINTLNTLLDLVTQIVYYGLMTFASLVALVGTFRKGHRTFKGRNLVLHNPESVE